MVSMIWSLIGVVPFAAASASPEVTYRWPVTGPVVNDFDAPTDPYGAGHRGIDIAAPGGSPISAAAEGTVAFAGRIGSALYVSIDHADGVRTTYSFLGSISVHRGDAVGTGQTVATTGVGHLAQAQAHFHFGAKIGDVYLDPLSLLERPDLTGWIRLVPG